MLTRNDKILIFSLVTVVSLFFVRIFLISGEGSEALIKVGNAPVQRVPLRMDRTINLEGEKGRVILEVREGTVRVVQSSCLQKICVNTGWINRPGQTIVCLPNKVLITIEGKESSKADAVSY